MRGTSGIANGHATEIRRLKSQDADENVSGPIFGAVCKLCWPRKTAAKLASIAGKDERTAARWLSGEVQAPPIIFNAIEAEIIRRG